MSISRCAMRIGFIDKGVYPAIPGAKITLHAPLDGKFPSRTECTTCRAKSGEFSPQVCGHQVPVAMAFPSPYSVRELPEPQAPFSQEFSQSARLRPLHQGLVGRQSIISTTLSLILPVLFGLAFGLGHNFFYWHLDGRPVDSGRIFSVPDQQWVAQIGIAFAFITKTCFAAAISTAFVQQVWMTVSRKPVPLSGIDSLWSILRYVRKLIAKVTLSHHVYL